MKAQVIKDPREDVFGNTHTETPTKTWDSFGICVMFHLQTVFQFDAGEALKYYITNTLKKPKQVSMCEFFAQVEQLISYLETLPFLHYNPKTNPVTKRVLPLDDFDLSTHLFCMCPDKWQTQYNF